MSNLYPRQRFAIADLLSRPVIDPPTGEMTVLMEETAEEAMELSKALDPVVHGRLIPKTGKKNAVLKLQIQMLQNGWCDRRKQNKCRCFSL